MYSRKEGILGRIVVYLYGDHFSLILMLISIFVPFCLFLESKLCLSLLPLFASHPTEKKKLKSI